MPKTIYRPFALLLFALAACGGGETGTPCNDNAACGDDLACDHTGACVALTCPDLAGCCAPGETGCGCGDGCSVEGDVCVDERCAPRDCMPGREGCACGVGGCGVGLACVEDRCVDDTGRLGGSCFSDATCTRSLRCQNDVCVPCTVGSQGCGCDGTRCNDGLVCHEGLCHTATGLASNPPTGEDACFTPCTTDGAVEGSFVDCPADGLLPGCFGETTCVEGTCRPNDGVSHRCSNDVDCPDFQACLLGTCRSNCNTDEQCIDGAICHRYVCRKTCNTAEAPCDANAFCSTGDGENGVCLPLDTPVEPAPSTGSFELAPTSIAFSNIALETTIQLTHSGATAARYFVEKKRDLVFRDDAAPTATEASNDCEGRACPLSWLTISAKGQSTSGPSLDVIVDPGETVTITLAGGADGPSTKWEGEIEVHERSLGRRSLLVRYAERPDGRWSGKSFVFGNFGDAGLEEWLDRDKSPSAIANIRNAFLQVWARFRTGTASLDELQAALLSIRTESWRSPAMEQRCPSGSACFPFTNADGFAVFTNDPLTVPVPSGAVELPVAIDLRAHEGVSALDFEGRIATERALQYFGNPRIDVRLAADPTACRPSDGPCVVGVDDFTAQILVGGQFPSSRNDAACDGAEGFVHVKTPWLVTGFEGRSERDPATGRRYTYACRNRALPLEGDQTAAIENSSLASANPIRNGQTRHRTVRGIDGVLIDGHTLLVLFEEAMQSPFDDDDPITTYGVMILERIPNQLDANAFVGNAPAVPANEPDRQAPIACSPELLAQAVGDPNALAPDRVADNASAVAQAIVLGAVRSPTSPAPIDGDDDVVVHYLCEELGLFDFGVDVAAPAACPVGSGVRFFIVDRGAFPNGLAGLGCQQDGSCGTTLERWSNNGSYGLVLDPVWRCTDADVAYCSEHRTDLRVGKDFFVPSEEAPVFVPLRAAIDDAFRYRTRFVNRSGTSVGFVPEICAPMSNAVPYCYDPPAIEAVRERVDCAIAIENTFDAHLDQETRELLMSYLEDDFGYAETFDEVGRRSVRFGFEHLDAELSIMLGDDAYAKALASRFDLAGSQLASFEGDLFEPNGLQLSGAAGFEMLSLYTAVQYYDATLERFFRLSPALSEAIETAKSGNARSFITQSTVVSYFDRLTRASTQKARAWSEIAKRYQGFNRPDLARHVIERAYTAAHLEAAFLHHLATQVVNVSTPEEVDQIRRQIEAAQRIYRIALTGMQDRYADIEDGVDFFGFSPAFIPFPALEFGRDNPFEVAMARARQRMEIAKEAEQVALANNRSFETDAAAFQNELVRIRTTYEGQLSELCGTMTGEDGRIYPAISKYAYLEPSARIWGDPCGLMQTGSIHTSNGSVQIALNEVRRVRQAMTNVLEEARIEGQRWSASCGVAQALARAEWVHQGKVNVIQTVIDAQRDALSLLGRFEARATTIAGLSACDPLSCGPALAAGTAFVNTAIAVEAATSTLESAIRIETAVVREMERNFGLVRADFQCDQIEIDGRARVRTILLRLAELKLEALRSQYEFGQALANLRQQRNQATRLQAEMAEVESLAINVEAARNNPNIRIYRNDAVINADETFRLALREAYAATRVLEYYTSQSYADLDKLFLTRMVTAGDFNLQRYIIGIEDRFREFEDQYGLPDFRLARLSLRDDILQIPRTDENGTPLTEGERTERLRDQLTSGRLLDEDGYLVVPFATSLAQLSPLTKNHQIRYVEAEIIGSEVGDPLGRVYLRMAGTGAVSSLDDELLFYTFPERTAVINPFFNGNRIYVPEVYRSKRLQSRPFINSRWELVFNQRDETVNEDINLRSITDLRLYVYYSDFTEL